MMDLEKYEIIAFDWDGTLVDSHNIYREIDRIFVQKNYGLNMSRKFFDELYIFCRNTGKKDYRENYYQHIDKIFGDGTSSFGEIENKIKNIITPSVISKIPYRSNSCDILRAIRSTYPNKKLALVTGSKKREIDLFSDNCIKKSDCISPNSFFDLIITRDNVINHKPHPEPYQKVTEHFSTLGAFETLAIENSLSGIKSAKSAGMDVIAIFDEHRKEEQQEINEVADHVINNWRDFYNLMESNEI